MDTLYGNSNKINHVFGGGSTGAIPQALSGMNSLYTGSYLGGLFKAEGGPVGKVPALLSPGEIYLPPGGAEKVAKGVDPKAVGKEVPGKPKVSGAKNDYANDTVKASLDEGGVVLPRSVTKSKDMDKKAIAFAQAVLAHHGLKK
jgi:hypothetical protein